MSTEDIRREREIIGMPVYAAREGKLLGEVSNLLIALPDSRVGALAVRSRHGQFVVPLSRISVIGPDAVMIDAEATFEAAVSPEETAGLTGDLVGRAVITAGGEKLGQIAGLFVEPSGGRIVSYRVRSSGNPLAQLAALATGDRLDIPPEGLESIGPDAVIVRLEPQDTSPPPTPLPPA